MIYSHAPQHRDGHEFRTLAEMARRLAAIKGDAYGGECPAGPRPPGPQYLVPKDTLTTQQADALNVHGEQDLFGGVVPHDFMKTKIITHGLLAPTGSAPAGWSHDFSRLVGEDVLPGYSAFSLDEARAAGRALLAQGTVRVKRSTGIGGLGQTVVNNAAELEACLAGIPPEELHLGGVVLEANLEQVETYSVGCSVVDEMLISYCGTQRLTGNNRGEQVYGGSDLFLVRGDFDALLQLQAAEPVGTVVRQARAYHDAVLSCYPGFYASRANYDVAQGRDDFGQWRSGVLEQSWRIGGASAAELLAMAAFQQDPGIKAVRACTAEVYGPCPELPPQARIHYQGTDEKVGELTKYSLLLEHVHA